MLARAEISSTVGTGWFVYFADYNTLKWDQKTRKFEIEKKINNIGYETFMPARHDTVMRRQRRTKVVTPAFGHYGFVKFDRDADDWGNLRPFDLQDGSGVRGFIDLLKNHDVPVRVPHLVMERLIRAAELGFFDARPLPIGTSIEIMEGPFAGIIGKINSASKSRRVKVLLKLLGTIEVDPCFLRKI